jgi:hypothetical protein
VRAFLGLAEDEGRNVTAFVLERRAALRAARGVCVYTADEFARFLRNMYGSTKRDC